MSDAPETAPAAERKLAVDTFNETWTLLEKANRTQEETDRMIHAAHASRYHWEQAGTVVNLVRGEWQCSRVYAVLGLSESARYHARRCLELCEANGIGDFDLAFAHEAMARASAATGAREEALQHLSLAEEAGGKIADAEDREHFVADLAAGPWYGVRDDS